MPKAYLLAVFSCGSLLMVAAEKQDFISVGLVDNEFCLMHLPHQIKRGKK